MALTSAAAMADCACIPRVKWATRHPQMTDLATVHRKLGMLCWNSWGLRGAGFDAKHRLLKGATSGWGPANWFRRSARRGIVPVVVK